MTTYFIGAGIGGIEYLTVRAYRILQQAEVVLYDALVDDSVLELVPRDCLKISVGKRGGKDSTPQSKIDRLLIEYSQKYDRVIRLKSGDVGIFGRINEELYALDSIDADYELIPGISSALAVPLLAKIMLTEKDDSRCVSIVTGHNPDLLNWQALSKIDTLVILMGGRNLPIIVGKLLDNDLSSDFPIAIIKNGGRANQQIWRGRLDNIVVKTANQTLSPCIIVISKMVGKGY